MRRIYRTYGLLAGEKQRHKLGTDYRRNRLSRNSKKLFLTEAVMSTHIVLLITALILKYLLLISSSVQRLCPATVAIVRIA